VRVPSLDVDVLEASVSSESNATAGNFPSLISCNFRCRAVMNNKHVNDDFRGGRVFAEPEVGEFGGPDDPAADAQPFVFDGDR